MGFDLFDWDDLEAEDFAWIGGIAAYFEEEEEERRFQDVSLVDHDEDEDE
jgi:hypothetical protein